MTNSTKGFLSGFLIAAGFITMDINVVTAIFAMVVGYLGIHSVLKGN